MRKTAWITGASRGIGAAIAKELAKEGYDLILNCCHSKEELLTLARQLEQSCSIRTLCCIGDIGDHDYVTRSFEKIQQFTPHVDVLINNAGISYIGLLTDMDITDWNRVLDTNLTSVFSCSRLVIPSMVRRQSGQIINISSAWGNVGASCEVAYSASKAGIHGFTRALAKELAPSNIQVNAIACGVIDTSMNACFEAEERRMLEEEIPAGRFGTAEEVADLVKSLLTAPSYLTGQIIGLDGGWI